MDALDASRLFDQLARELPDVAAAAVTDGLDVMLLDAQRLSSGMETAVDHRRKDHPYAKRHKQVKAPSDPIIINFQTGDFLRNWATEGPIESADQIAGSVVNFDDKAGWLEEGTKVMLGRDLPGAVEERTAADVEAAVERRIEQIFNH